MIPPALRARAEASPGDTIGSFHHQLNVLRRTGGYIPRAGFGEFGAVPVPRTPVKVSANELSRKRRRDVLVTLVWMMAGTLVIGLMPSFRGMLVLHAVVDVMFLGYVALLRRSHVVAAAQRAERKAKVTRLQRLPEGVADLSQRRAAIR